MDDRRSEPRGLLAGYSNPVYGGLRTAIEKAGTVYGAVGIFLIAGLIVAGIGTGIFVEVAEHVTSGSTQAFDDAVIRWLGAHHTKTLDGIMLEITSLGTGTVVMMIVAVAAL